MVGSKFSPRLELLDTRLCLSTTGGEVMAVDMFKPGEEVSAAVDYFLVNNEKGWDVKPGEEVGAAVDYKAGESGWDVKPGEDGSLLPAVRVDDGGRTVRAAVDYFYPTDQIGGPFVGDLTAVKP